METQSSKPTTKSSRIREAIALNPDWNNHEIASLTGATATLVSVVRNNEKRKALGLTARRKLKRKKTKAKDKPIKFVPAKVIPIVEVIAKMKDTLVDNPPHYTVGGMSTYDFIIAKNLSYELGNVVKYVSRADYKGNKLQDLQKALWYLNAAIKREESK